MKMIHLIISMVGLGVFILFMVLYATPTIEWQPVSEIKPTKAIPPVTVSESSLVVQPRGCGFCVDAGCNQTIYLPGNVVKLRGDAISDSGMVVMWLWTQLSGPRGCVIQKPTSKETLVNGLVAGTYEFNFRATTQYEVTKSVNVIITVEAYPE